MIVKLLTEHHLEFLSLKEGCRGSSESTLVKMLNCWKSHTAAQNIKTFLAFKLSDVVFIMLIDVKMPTIAGILTFMSMVNFMLS